MTTGALPPQELIGYRRSTALPGIEVIDARDSPREWRVICPVHAVVVFRTWRGRVHSRGRLHSGAPGIAFCNTPGEAMVAKPEGGPGSFNVLELRSELLEEWLSEQHARPRRLDWAAVMRPISHELGQKFRGFFEAFQPGVSALQLQSQVVDLSEIMIRELIAGSERPTLEGPPIRGTARMRECLNEEGLDIDLDTLASRVGLTRFQALRAFKRRYGLPPHAYQMCLRVTRAQRLLLEGVPAAEVAVRCGFVDQSHFIRHFKRLSGVTPMQYARAHTAPSQRSSGVFLAGSSVPEDPSSIVSRSDHR